MDLLARLAKQAKKNPKKIVYTDAPDKRLLQALKEIKNYAQPILVGNKDHIEQELKKYRVKGVAVIDIKDSLLRPKAVEELLHLRAKKGLTKKQAQNLLLKKEYFGAMMVQLGIADAMIGGATSTTAELVRPALQIIGTKEKFHRVSSVFIMEINKKIYFFADCAVNVAPDAKTLSEIALDSAQTARSLGITPRVALLSFSTKGSYEGPEVKHIRKAALLARKKDPSLLIDGELQADAALVPSIAKRKLKEGPIQGNANVLIFPDLNSGNISYKLLERLGHAKAIGPLLQGLKKPINDLSRGCSAQDIVNLTILTSTQ
ncbi:phosphate acetyltransferase [Candidatus Woesearchaeota archaeon]|nr:MAG: phosphate acetyltransferase [Candidatus Woesearchaeota archaeon]